MSKSLWDDSYLIQLIEWVNFESIRLIGEGNNLSTELLQKCCSSIISLWAARVASSLHHSKEEEFVNDWVYDRFQNIFEGIRYQSFNKEESILDSMILLATFYDENKDYWSSSCVSSSIKVSFVPKIFNLSITED
jgi:hypothetical protein